MTQEYVGEEFRAPFCEALAKGPVEWETLSCGEWFCPGTKYVPTFAENWTYRFKPMPKRMISMYDKHGKPHQLVAPEREALAIGTPCFRLASLGVESFFWRDNGFDATLLRCGNVFLTREDAQAMAEFQREQREGV